MPPAGKKQQPDRPQHGDHCPVCNNGLLYKTAEHATGYALRCFNCDTTGTIPIDGDYVAVIADGAGSPTGFVLTESQLAAKGALDVEQATQRARAAEGVEA